MKLINTGKIRIGEKWEDPTLDSPILRALPRGTHLHLVEEAKMPLNELGDVVLKVVLWLIGLTILAQLAGLI